MTQSTRMMSSMVAAVGQLTVLTSDIESNQAGQLLTPATTNQNTALLPETDQSEHRPVREELL